MPFVVTMMLADAAHAAEGKLYILGGGWSVATPGAPSAIALYIKVPWDLTNTEHRLLLELLDASGEPVLVEGPERKMGALRFENRFEVGRPPGTKPGWPIDMPVALNLGPLPLTPGASYTWRLSIDDQTNENWSLPFLVAPVIGEPHPSSS